MGTVTAGTVALNEAFASSVYVCSLPLGSSKLFEVAALCPVQFLLAQLLDAAAPPKVLLKLS